MYPPAGRLGIVLDNPPTISNPVHQMNDSSKEQSPTQQHGPIVCMIKENSPLLNMVEVGDYIVAVDDIDVRNMSPTKVSKFMNQRSKNPARKLTFIRNMNVVNPKPNHNAVITTTTSMDGVPNV